MVGNTLARKLKVSNARAELRLTQQNLADEAGISRGTVSSVEHGGIITRLNAFAILNALNKKREAAGKSSLSIDDLEWKVQGESE